MTQHPPKWLQMTIKELNQQRSSFQLLPGVATSSEELPLLEKQALIDEIFRGMPIKQIEYYEHWEPSGKVYMVVKGWPQLRAIWDFLDDKFPTWSDEDRRQWEQSHEAR